MTIKGKVIITGQLMADTALHIGAASTGLEISGVDKMVVRNPLDNRPYVPGSSLKGKMRALLERASGLAEVNKRVWVKRNEVSMHLCDEPNCIVCEIYGRNNGKFPRVDDSSQMLEIKHTTPTRLLVRDGQMREESAATLKKSQTDLPYTEVKWEVGIDRITSAANPRQMERVPAGASFGCEMIYSIYSARDRDYLQEVFKAMHLLEDDYLGGHGSRGSGKVSFRELAVEWRPDAYYKSGNASHAKSKINDENTTVVKILESFDALKAAIVLGGE